MIKVLQYPDLYPGAALLQQGVYIVFVLAIEDKNRGGLGGLCILLTVGVSWSLFRFPDFFF